MADAKGNVSVVMVSLEKALFEHGLTIEECRIKCATGENASGNLYRAGIEEISGGPSIDRICDQRVLNSKHDISIMVSWSSCTSCPEIQDRLC